MFSTQPSNGKSHASDNGKSRIAEMVSTLSPVDVSPLTPIVPEDAPFTDGQRQWLNGLLAGLTVLARAAHGQGHAPVAPDAPAVPLTILYGSQSGNCEALSKDLRKHATAVGYKPQIKELNDITPDELAAIAKSEAGRVLILCSTFGEGDPPDNAAKFCQALYAHNAPDLTGLSYSVCGLGDSSYTHFNKTGRDLDARLSELGATRAAEFTACDVAYEDDYAHWKAAVFASEMFHVEHSATSDELMSISDKSSERYGKNNPFYALVLSVHNLSGPGSAKEVNHIEISLSDSGLIYEAGDTLGIWPTNCPELVQAILDAAGFTGSECVQLKTGPGSLRAALLSQLDICTVTAKTLESFGIDIEPTDVDGMHAIDLIERDRPAISPQQLVDALRPLQPRLYSIASSPNAHPGEVHLTVGAVRYQANGKPRKGVASTFLADQCGCGTRLGVYLQRSKHFHLPADDVPLIMIGPGTGIAPFRAFLEERALRENKGRSWLFFGDQHEVSDFLYREQIEGWLADGTLERFDAAWSRDQHEKVYVQHRMLEHGHILWEWLESGAAVYVCGDATRMAKDVDEALRKIVALHGGRNATDAAEYIEKLKAEHRYQRDVY